MDFLASSFLVVAIHLEQVLLSSHPCDLLDDAGGEGSSQQTTLKYFLKYKCIL